MFKKISRAILIALLILNSLIVNVNAKQHEYYTLDISTLDDDVKPYISSIVIEKDGYDVYVNNEYVGNLTNFDSQTFIINWNPVINLTISLNNLSANAKVTVVSTKVYRSAFSFQIENNTYYTCTFYPEYGNSSGAQTIQSTRNGDIHSFGTFTATYGDETKTFDVQLYESSGAVYVNGSYLTTIEKSSVPVIFEYIGNNFAITNIDYQSSLKAYNWPVASSSGAVYSNVDLNNIAFKQEYLMSNDYLNLSSYLQYYDAWVNEYKRVSGTSESGTGVWQATGNKIKVICEWTENNTCGKAMQAELPRYWAIKPNGLKKSTISLNSITKTVGLYKKKVVVGYTKWSTWQTSAPPEYDDLETRTTYSSRTYADTWASVCDSSDGYSLGTRQLYRYCTKSCSEWNYQYDNWSAYSTSKTGDYQDQCVSRTGINSECGTKTVTYDCSYNEDYDCSYNTTESYRCSVYVSKTCYYYGTTCSTCSRQEKYDCGYGKYGYSCKVRTVNYSCNCRSEVTGSYECGSNQDSTCSRTVHVSKTCSRTIYQDCSTKETQRCTSYSCPLSRTANSCKTYGDCTNWTSWSTSACQNTAYNTCESTTQYNCRVFSGWSEYSTSSCDTSNSMICKSQIEYRWRYANWGDWVDGYETCGTDYQTQCKWYLGSVDVNVVTLNKNAVTLSDKSSMTYDMVEAWQEEYAVDQAKYDYYREQDPDDDGYILYDEELDIRSTDAYTYALSGIRNAKIYQPYLYFYGWRFETSNQMLPVSSGEGIVTTAKKTNIYTDSYLALIEISEKMERESKVIYYDYHDPLVNYGDDIPENWSGYADLIEQIKASDLSDSKITVTISKDDLQKMREWVYENGSDTENCSMLKEFSYIFDAVTKAKIDSMHKCNIE